MNCTTCSKGGMRPIIMKGYSKMIKKHDAEMIKRKNKHNIPFPNVFPSHELNYSPILSYRNAGKSRHSRKSRKSRRF